MTITEIKKDARETFQGKFWQVCKIIISYLVICILLNALCYGVNVLATNMMSINPFNALKIMVTNSMMFALAISMSTDAWIIWIAEIYCVIYLLLSIAINSLLMYGLFASIMEIWRGERVGIFSIFQKIGENLKKVLGIIGWLLIKEAIYTIIWYVLYMVLYYMLLYGGSILLINIMMIICVIGSLIYLYKTVELLYAIPFTYRIVKEYPDVKARKILKKAHQLFKKNIFTYLSSILTVWWNFLAIFVVIAIIFIGTLWFQYNVPLWFSIMECLIFCFMSIFISIKTLEISASFYESINIEGLFEPTYVVPKEKIRYFFILIGLCLLYVGFAFLLILGLTAITNAIINDTNNDMIIIGDDDSTISNRANFTLYCNDFSDFEYKDCIYTSPLRNIQ